MFDSLEMTSSKTDIDGSVFNNQSGLTIDGGQRYSQTVDRPFHVSMASLEINPQYKGSHVQVMIQQESSQFLLCTLGPGSHLQQQLDLHFSSGETVEFFLVGKGVVHLTGSLVGERKEFTDDYREDEYNSAESEEELNSDDEEDEDWVPEELVRSKRKASEAMLGKKKKMKVTEPDDEDDDFIDDSALEEEEEEEDESEEDEDDDSETDVSTKLPSPREKTSAMNTTSEVSPASKKKKKNKQLKTGMEQQEKKRASSAGDASSGDATPSKKKKKRKRRKSKEEHGNQHEQSTNGSQEPQEPQSPTPKSAPAVGKKRTVAGGTSVEDVKIGHGPEAKPGKMVSVYYSGILAKSNKRFDSCLNGKPFRFRLGRGEVIKGWDTGLIGMKVGGKRKIVVPPSQGYGNARQGPIPPGSILVFDVEMKAVN